MKQTVRIIGGQFRGKKLPFPAEEGLRPTPDRVRETVFNWLMHDIRDARCLDAFAGSGALGFEAFSRAAASVIFLETNPIAAKNLTQIASSFHSTTLCIKQIDALKFLQHTNEHFHVVFLDPPFSENLIPACLDLLITRNILLPGGFVYLESPQAIVVDETQWRCLKLKTAGQVVYGLYSPLDKRSSSCSNQ